MAPYSIHNANTRCIVGAFYTVKREMKFILIYAICNECKKCWDGRMGVKIKKRHRIRIEHWTRNIKLCKSTDIHIVEQAEKRNLSEPSEMKRWGKKTPKPFRDRLNARKNPVWMKAVSVCVALNWFGRYTALYSTHCHIGKETFESVVSSSLI